MNDVRKGFVRRGWDVIQASGHIGGLRRQLVIHGSHPLVLVVSSHSSVARRYGHALLTLLGDRISFEGVIATIVLLEDECDDACGPTGAVPSSSSPPPVGAGRWATSVGGSRFAADEPSERQRLFGGPRGIEWPCDLRAHDPEEVIAQAIACGASGHPDGLHAVRERMLDRHRHGSVLGEIGSVDA